jgi:ATP-binding cassette subfamily B protein RaxB
VSTLIDKAFEMRLLRLHAERLADVVQTAPEERPPAGRLLGASGCALSPTIEMRGVRFRYADHEPYVLDGLDLAVAARESVAIVGASGCGKSTLLHIALGMLTPTHGEVLIGGVPLAHLGHDLLRRTVASVAQNDCLFGGTIGDNICFFDAEADHARIEECARLASIHADIAALPMAYNTLVGFMGSTLSAGQQQRILLARALYARPSILILDEATSHLDVRREADVCAALRGLAITRVVVAHRPQTAATADRVLILNAGRLTAPTARATG